MECDAWVLGLRLHGVSMCLHEPGLEILLEGARFHSRKTRNGWDQHGREVIVEHLRVVRAIGAGRRTWGSAFLFIVQKTKRSTTCPT